MISLDFQSRLVRRSYAVLRTMGVKTVKQELQCGGSLIVDTNDQLAVRLRLEYAFEPAVRLEFERIARQRVNIIDIGANIGYYSVLGAKLIGPDNHVFSFEPQATVVDKLKRNLEQSGVANVTVFPVALSDSNGTTSFCVPTAGVEAYGSFHPNGRFKVQDKVEVKTARLDDIMVSDQISNIGLVKMDCEGAELMVLRGASKLLSSVSKPVLIFEANEENLKPFGHSVFELLQYVSGFGYRLRQVDSEDWIAEPQS